MNTKRDIELNENAVVVKITSTRNRNGTEFNELG